MRCMPISWKSFNHTITMLMISMLQCSTVSHSPHCYIEWIPITGTRPGAAHRAMQQWCTVRSWYHVQHCPQPVKYEYKKLPCNKRSNHIERDSIKVIKFHGWTPSARLHQKIWSSYEIPTATNTLQRGQRCAWWSPDHEVLLPSTTSTGAKVRGSQIFLSNVAIMAINPQISFP